MTQKKFDLEERFVDLAADIATFCHDLTNDFTGQFYGNQLLRSAGSAALNLGEAQGTNSNKDFVYRATITLRELKESRVILKILKKINYGNKGICIGLLDEVEQLIKITATVIKKKK
ncbi:four helix bundle protein [Flagellimonas zhangzhouensis]|uniref:Four helix bundle protein n=1 Tax=Flagellimonas zhangzhouensis TaxID=1073328 RepID=A0A1H2UYT3_9FLAO|nr:four helix bundle protein [Allomuricauda zhangzhouensis]SDQ12416.1 four helix bundle protein [Allomuricauda zhangzhouensis]SDW61253.1 four helix bundle protein [Allomuricauda zhangzhouensis]